MSTKLIVLALLVYSFNAAAQTPKLLSGVEKPSLLFGDTDYCKESPDRRYQRQRVYRSVAVEKVIARCGKFRERNFNREKKGINSTACF